MLKNIIVISLRILLRNKVFSLINILGLTMGISCALLILTFVRFQLSTDKFHENKDNLFALQQLLDLGTGPYRTDRTGGACGPALTESFPEITSYVRFSQPIELLLTYDHPDSAGGQQRKKFIENTVLPVDSNFLSLFSFPALSGDPLSALDEPGSIVLTEGSAEKYFGDADALGKDLTINGRHGFTVSAVLENPPTFSSIQFDFLINFRFLEEFGHNLDGYDGNPFFTFLYIDNTDDIEGLELRISEHLDEFQSEDLPAEQSLISLKEYSRKGEQRGRIFITMMTILGVILLSIACINFVNLTTARYLSRTKEVGLRKVAGARRPQLIRQFIGETMILVFIALNLSILAVDMVLPVFNQNFETEVELTLTDPAILLGLLAVFLLASFMSGSYPAFFLSSVKAVNVFSKVAPGGKRGGGIRRILVVIQFIFTIIFVISTITNFKQFKLLKNANLEFSTADIIYFPVRGDLYNHLPDIKQEILANPSVSHVTGSEYMPRFADRGELEWGLTAEDRNDIALIFPVNYDFEETFTIELEEGRFYDEDMPADTVNSIIINRSVARVLGYEEPVGKTMYLSEEAYTIIGVIRDYVFNPLALGGENAILPFTDEASLMFVKSGLQDKKPLIDYLEEIHEKFNPDYPFTPLYLEDYLDPVTESLGEMNKLLYFFTVFGILISCMGLLGLSIFTIEQRIKEIGIRKSLGATSLRIIRLVTIDFLRLILISLLIAIPASILLMRVLLKMFAEKVSMGPGLFLFATLVVFLISILTVGFQALRAARSNPADSLRYE